MGFPPKAFIIGAQKAGTTTLASLLDQHPRIALSRPKEPDFFSTHWERGLDWYRSRFPNSADVLLDASTTYAMAPMHPKETAPRPWPDWGRDVPRRIWEVQPEAKLIYMLREPVERTYSAYWHTVRFGGETKPLRNAIASNPDYIDTSRYCCQIKLYLEYFSYSSFMFINFDDLVANPFLVANRSASFILDEPVNFPFEFDGAKNKGFQYKILGQILRSVAGSDARMEAVSSTVRRATPGWSHKLLRRMVSTDLVEMHPEDRRWLSALFEDDNRKLERLTGIGWAVRA